jgi:hypothetical protein
MHTCLFIKLIYKDPEMTQEGCYVEKEITLPFVPFIGLRIGVGNRHAEKITEVTYFSNDPKFYCRVEAGAPIAPIEFVNSETPNFLKNFDNYKDAYLGSGWKLNWISKENLDEGDLDE